MTTEAIHSTATQQLAVSAQIRPQWREPSSTIHNTSSSSPFYASSSSPVNHDRSFNAEPLPLFSKPITIKDSSMRIIENVQQAPANSSYPPITTPKSYERCDKKLNYQIMSGANAKDDGNTTSGFDGMKEDRKKDDITLYSCKSAPNKQEQSNWQTLVDSEDETSEEYDAGDDDSEEEDDENVEKAGVSDTETRNLLEDGLEDDDDYHDSANITSDDINTSTTQHTPSINNLVLEKGSTSEDKMQERVLASNISDESLFEMSHEQVAYYKKCFVYLIELTQGAVDLKGAVHGVNEKVVEFFKKSGLSTETLSKIWTLSDVNADGFLDLAEFSTAMHLIVLNLKGKIPVPDHLPNSIRPPLTPPRMLIKTTNQPIPTAKQSNWKQFDFDESKRDISQMGQPSHSNANNHQQHYHSLSDDHLHVHINKSETPEHLSDFSDVPPLLVDGRPTALKATQPLICPSAQLAGAVSQTTTINTNRVPPPSSSSSLKLMNEEALRLTLSPSLPKGPPPKPPPRPSNKGHGRSASLDLNTLANTKLVCSTNGMNSGMMLAQTARGGTLPTQSSLMRFNNSSNATNYVSQQQQQQSVISSTSSISQSSNTLPPHSSISQVCGLQTPPLSARPSFAAPPPPRRSTVQDSETQTDDDQDSTDKSRHHALSLSSSKPISASLLSQQPELIQFNVHMEKRIEQLLADENFAMSESESGTGTSVSNVNWKERCSRLQKLNEELEMERCKLAQIRLQLQMKLQDISGNNANVTTPSSIKPTSL